MSNWKFKLLYDGECPLCLQEVRMLRRWDRQGGLAFEDITSPEVDPAKYGATREELMGVIHGVFPDGRVVRRMEVFRQAYAAVGRGWLSAPTGWPILKPIFDWGYEIFARNRMPIGRLLGRNCESGTCAVRRPTAKR